MKASFVSSFGAASLSAALLAVSGPQAQAATKPAHAASTTAPSDAALLKTLPGFQQAFASVNGVRLHYVVGGEGPPLVLLPGWPETWWSYHKVMPALAKHHRLIVVDLRGMGQSDKPEGGYDKKTMAGDIRALVRHLGYEKVDIAGHDIGSMVAYAYAANYSDATRKLVMMDVAHPDKGLATWALLPDVGGVPDKMGDSKPYPWWFAFHQVRGLPEDLVADRPEVEQRWFFKYLLVNDGAIDATDRAVYAAAYRGRRAYAAGTAWYQAFPQDIVDDGAYGKIKVPVLALGGPGYFWLKATLTGRADALKLVKVEGSGHFVAEEKPAFVTAQIDDFLR